MAPPLPRPPPRGNPFRLLFDAHGPYVGRLARSFGVRDADVPDVVQLVFVALHQAIDRGLDTSVPLLGWLRTITVRTARDHRKLASHERERLADSGDLETPDTDRTPEERVQAIDMHRLVNEVLDALPPEQRLVLVMSDMEEMPMSEIAADLEIAEDTGYTRLRAARSNFRAACAERRSQAAFLPFALWEPSDLLHGARAVPPMSAESMDDIWRGLVRTLGPGIVGAGLAGGALAPAVAKAGAVLTAKQAVIGAVVAVLVGVGLHAAFVASRDEPPAPQVIASRDEAPAASAVAAPPAPSASVVVAPRVVTTTTTSATTETEASERAWLATARDALEQGNTKKARDALAHVRSPRFAGEREDLRRLLPAAQDGGP